MDQAIRIVFDLLANKYQDYVADFNRQLLSPGLRNRTDNLIIKDF